MKTRKLLVTLALLAAAAMPDPAASADDSAWFSLGSGLNDAVRTLELAGTDLYVAGNFSDAGGDPYADKVARWDGASWHPLGTQPGSWFYAVTAVATAGANVYAADRCSIRHWDGSTWQRMASPLDCTWTFFYAIAVGERGVYVGGSFQNFEGKANADNIALWHGMHLMPDTILYSRYQAATSTREVRLVNADGTNDRGIVSGSFPRLSRNRDYIAFLREGGYPPCYYIMDKVKPMVYNRHDDPIMCLLTPSASPLGSEDPLHPALRAPWKDRPPSCGRSHCRKRFAPRAP